MRTSRLELAELKEKYVEMRRLRLEHAAGTEQDPRRHMAALASRFPGSLREIDELPLEEIERRVTALAEAEHDEARVEPWMHATSRFHALTRGALCTKRWLAGRKTVDEEVSRAFHAAAGTLCYGVEARAWQDDLARLAAPPRGRVTDLVYEKISAEMGISEEDARKLVFGPGRRSRRDGGG